MGEDQHGSRRTRHPTDGGIVRRRIEPDSKTSEYALLEIVADLEGKTIEELPSLYDQVDHFIELLYREPPSPEAQVSITFSYAGYRISIDQSGTVELVAVKDSVDSG